MRLRGRRLVAVSPRGLIAIGVGALAGVAGLTGCGSSRPGVPLGRATFASGCQTCHSLIGNESLRKVGGDLLGYRLPRTELIELVREMPARRALDAAEIAAVSDYVLGLEQRAVRRCSTGRC